ncbi:MAG: MerR family transcriptional regulator [Chitinispirillales bacterium]|jgi:DNA-binding transcriptional MerR regulator|nr:MerR family transcriptional regulator [Chitinispirillales bacterium]
MSDKNFTNDEQQSPPIGKKLYYTIKEVCQMTGLSPHTLRNWEDEFFQLRPKKNSAGNRAYRDKDIELVFQIKRLLQEKKYTISGAREIIREERREKRLSGRGGKRQENTAATAGQGHETLKISTQPALPPSVISNIRAELDEILRILGS